MGSSHQWRHWLTSPNDQGQVWGGGRNMVTRWPATPQDPLPVPKRLLTLAGDAVLATLAMASSSSPDSRQTRGGRMPASSRHHRAWNVGSRMLFLFSGCAAGSTLQAQTIHPRRGVGGTFHVQRARLRRHTGGMTCRVRRLPAPICDVVGFERCALESRMMKSRDRRNLVHTPLERS